MAKHLAGMLGRAWQLVKDQQEASLHLQRSGQEPPIRFVASKAARTGLRTEPRTEEALLEQRMGTTVHRLVAMPTSAATETTTTSGTQSTPDCTCSTRADYQIEYSGVARALCSDL